MCLELSAFYLKSLRFKSCFLLICDVVSLYKKLYSTLYLSNHEYKKVKNVQSIFEFKDPDNFGGLDPFLPSSDRKKKQHSLKLEKG